MDSLRKGKTESIPRNASGDIFTECMEKQAIIWYKYRDTVYGKQKGWAEWIPYTQNHSGRRFIYEGLNP